MQNFFGTIKTCVYALIAIVCSSGSILAAESTTTPGALMPGPRRGGNYWASNGTNLLEESRLNIPILSREGLFNLILKNQVVFVDTREKFEFDEAHLPHAINIPFSKIDEKVDDLRKYASKSLVPYCNWDFRAYVGARKMKENGIENIFMMFPHGLRGWEQDGLVSAGSQSGKNDKQAWIETLNAISDTKKWQKKLMQSTDGNAQSSIRLERVKRTQYLNLELYTKKANLQFIDAKPGDRLVLTIKAFDEDHWLIFPDFGVELHLRPGEERVIRLDIIQPGYYPFGCVSCCTRYFCKTKQAIIVPGDREDPLARKPTDY